jgi:hypothetical protein
MVSRHRKGIAKSMIQKTQAQKTIATKNFRLKVRTKIYCQNGFYYNDSCLLFSEAQERHPEVLRLKYGGIIGIENQFLVKGKWVKL